MAEARRGRFKPTIEIVEITEIIQILRIIEMIRKGFEEQDSQGRRTDPSQGPRQ